MDGQKNETKVVIKEGQILPKNCDRKTLRCCMISRRVLFNYVSPSDGKEDPFLSVYSIV